MNRKKIKSHVHELLLLIGVIGFITAISYAFIAAGPYVDNRLEIGLYVMIMFIILPVATYAVISSYMWILDRWLSD